MEFDVELPVDGMRNRQCVAGKSLGNLRRVVEVRIVCNRIDQKEIRACEIARLVGCVWALEIIEDRQANQRGKRLPVASNALLDDAEA